MSKSEVTAEAFPIHFAIANALGGTVYPFDQYQGPYISNFPNVSAKLWLIVEGDGPGFRVYNSVNDRKTGVLYQSETLLILDYASTILTGEKEKTFSVQVVETRTILVTYEVTAETEEEARQKAEDGETESETDHNHTLEVIGRTIFSVEED
jgi:hypothetical protein